MTTLTMKDEKRLEIIQRVFRGELTMAEGGLVLGVSERQCYRIKARVNQQGVKGVIHGNRGRPCKRKDKEKTVKRVVELARGKYRGFNDHHLTEKLKEQEQIEWSREKIRRILRSHGIASPRKRRANRQLISALREWKEKCPKSRLDLVFCNQFGEPRNRTGIGRDGLSPALRQAGV